MLNRIFIFLAFSTLICLASTFDVAAQEPATETSAPEGGTESVNEPIGYFLGLSVGQQMRKSGFQNGDFDYKAVLAGFKDGIEESESALTDEQLEATSMKIQELLQTRRLELLSKQKAVGEKYLADNAKQEDVQVLEGGVQYKVLKAGEGASPTLTDTVQVHYTGTLINGTVFDSSVQRGEPATFRVGQVIQGWQTALQKMKVGDKWMIYIPSDLAYGDRGAGDSIGPNEVLTFEVELLEIQ
jgi:FKBP-type peptidyl-prolyl cis-trans isomerase FklB